MQRRLQRRQFNIHSLEDPANTGGRSKPEGVAMNISMLPKITEDDGYILAEPAHPSSELKISFKASFKARDGHDLGVELSLTDFNDLLSRGFIRAVGPADEYGRIMYRLTEDGRRAASQSANMRGAW